MSERLPDEREKHRHDPLGSVVWALVLLWAGVSLLAQNLGYLDHSGRLDAWTMIFIGAGLLFLGEAVIRLLMPSYRRPVQGTLIFAIILLALGLGEALSWKVVGPLAVMAVGLIVLVRGLVSERRVAG